MHAKNIQWINIKVLPAKNFASTSAAVVPQFVGFSCFSEIDHSLQVQIWHVVDPKGRKIWPEMTSPVCSCKSCKRLGVLCSSHDFSIAAQPISKINAGSHGKKYSSSASSSNV